MRTFNQQLNFRRSSGPFLRYITNQVFVKISTVSWVIAFVIGTVHRSMTHDNQPGTQSSIYGSVRFLRRVDQTISKTLRKKFRLFEVAGAHCKILLQPVELSLDQLQTAWERIRVVVVEFGWYRHNMHRSKVKAVNRNILQETALIVMPRSIMK